jgi:hypothetical protein
MNNNEPLNTTAQAIQHKSTNLLGEAGNANPFSHLHYLNNQPHRSIAFSHFRIRIAISRFCIVAFESLF